MVSLGITNIIGFSGGSVGDFVKHSTCMYCAALKQNRKISLQNISHHSPEKVFTDSNDIKKLTEYTRCFGRIIYTILVSKIIYSTCYIYIHI